MALIVLHVLLPQPQANAFWAHQFCKQPSDVFLNIKVLRFVEEGLPENKKKKQKTKN